MSTEAQIAAKRANAELSSGPKSEEGKAASSRNNTKYGLSYVNTYFFLLPCESSYAYDNLLMDLRNEHSPMTRTEDTLVERMAQHHWLRCRAEFFESKCFDEEGNVDEKRLALYMRYRTSHERAFYQCFNELLKLRAERRKTQIGFESQKRGGGAHPQTREASDGERTPYMGHSARRSQGRSPAICHFEPRHHRNPAFSRRRKGETSRLTPNAHVFIRRINCVDTRPARRNAPATAAGRSPRRANQVVVPEMFQIEENTELDRRDPI